ncbi:ParB N-terminal domain-containing protein [Oricola indica]|uniref:ParB N-terminal domain-containing protein n=1 Tax=Oricola indica TaxID=2872591 RepID=UPI003CCBB4A0
MSKTPMNRVTALNEIRVAIAKNGLTYPGEKPKALTLPEISRRVSVFQRREISGRHADDQRHVEMLRRVIGTNPKKPKMLDPIVVWWGGNRWYVVDGHHRREAYQRVGVTVPVPVKVLGGTPDNVVTLEEAIAYAAAANSKDRLRMEPEDKANSAWLLTVLGHGSRTYVADKCSVSEALVSTMRRTLRTLKQTTNPDTGLSYTADDLVIMDWDVARKLSRGEIVKPDDSWDPDEALRARATDYRNRLYHHFGNKPQRDFEAFAMGLKESDKTIPSKYVQTPAWEGAIEDAIEAQVEEKLMELIDYLGETSGNPEAVRELRELALTYEYLDGPRGVDDEDEEDEDY